MLATTEQVAEQVAEQVKRIVRTLHHAPLTTAEAMKLLNLTHRPTFLYTYIKPALKAGLVEMTQAKAPRSPTQHYRLTGKGRQAAEGLDK